MSRSKESTTEPNAVKDGEGERREGNVLATNQSAGETSTSMLDSERVNRRYTSQDSPTMMHNK
jgi:hypothetical protein